MRFIMGMTYKDFLFLQVKIAYIDCLTFSSGENVREAD